MVVASSSVSSPTFSSPTAAYSMAAFSFSAASLSAAALSAIALFSAASVRQDQLPLRLPLLLARRAALTAWVLVCAFARPPPLSCAAATTSSDPSTRPRPPRLIVDELETDTACPTCPTCLTAFLPLNPPQISTPGQDTREDGHATADTPGAKFPNTPTPAPHSVPRSYMMTSYSKSQVI